MKKRVLLLAGLMACVGLVYAQTISWAHLQWEASTTVSAGGEFEALGLVFAEGVTDVAEPSGTAIEAQLGYGTSANPSDNAWTWADAPYHGTWGANLSYQVKITAPMVAGTYYYSFRFKLAGSQQWAYAGTEGLWDATDHPCKTFNVTATGGYVISWAYLQWQASTTVTAGSDFEAMGLAFADGLTNAAEKDHSAILAQIGYGATANPTDAGWTWKDAAFHSEWGDNFAYQQKIASPLTNGTYYFSFRFRLNVENSEWVYAGNDGLWDETTSPCKTFTVIGGASAITDISPDNNENAIYDMLGNRLSEPQKGINIINGQKIFIY